MLARIAVLFLLLSIPFTLAGCFIPTDKDIAKKLEAALREELHPQSVKVIVHRRSIFSTTVRKLDVTISGFTAGNMPFMGEATTANARPLPSTALSLTASAPPRRVRRVRIVDAIIRCHDFTVKQVPVKTMEVRMHEVRVPLQGNIAIESAETSNVAVTFDEAGLMQFVRTRKALPVSEPSLRLTTDGCIVSGKVSAFFNTRVEVAGRIMAKEKAVLYLDQPRVRVSEMKIPDIITKRLLDDINPLADVNADFNFPVPVAVKQITHGDGTLQFDATLEFPQAGRK